MAGVIADKNKRELDFSESKGITPYHCLDRRWSRTHGFFIIMGGFYLYQRRDNAKNGDDERNSREDDIPVHPLYANDICGKTTFEIEDEPIDIDVQSITIPTNAEINDKGKSDGFAKSLVLIQTSWFILQCIARAIEHLPVTHLEIVTLAYAGMNFMVYIFWWNKPLNVNRPVRVYIKSLPKEVDHDSLPLNSVESRSDEEQPLVGEYRSSARKLKKQPARIRTSIEGAAWPSGEYHIASHCSKT